MNLPNANEQNDSEVDVYIIGAGILMPEHFTFESIAALQNCKAIFALLPQEVRDWLKSKFKDIVVHDLFELYIHNAVRGENYDRAVKAILSTASHTRPVGYVTPGNPAVFDSVTKNLLAYGRKEGLVIRVIPGISSIDSIAVDLEYDIGSGIQIYEASSLVIKRIQLQVEYACLLFQISVFGTSRWPSPEERPTDVLKPLQNYLRNFYPESHEVVFIKSATSSAGKKYIKKATISSIGSIQNDELSGTSLFIPRLRIPSAKEMFPGESR